MDVDDITTVAELHLEVCIALTAAECAVVTWASYAERCHVLLEESRRILAEHDPIQ